jgi:hypothetical protein
LADVLWSPLMPVLSVLLAELLSVPLLVEEEVSELPLIEPALGFFCESGTLLCEGVCCESVVVVDVDDVDDDGVL